MAGWWSSCQPGVEAVLLDCRLVVRLSAGLWRGCQLGQSGGQLGLLAGLEAVCLGGWHVTAWVL